MHLLFHLAILIRKKQGEIVAMNTIKIIQKLFGLMLILFGLNTLFSFLPIPEKEGFALDFLHTLHEAKYIFPIVAAIMIGSGTLLLLNKWVAIGLLLQLPVSVNIFAFHLLHDWDGLIMAYIVFGLNNLLIIKNLNTYKILVRT